MNHMIVEAVATDLSAAADMSRIAQASDANTFHKVLSNDSSESGRGDRVTVATLLERSIRFFGVKGQQKAAVIAALEQIAQTDAGQELLGRILASGKTLTIQLTGDAGDYTIGMSVIREGGPDLSVKIGGGKPSHVTIIIGLGWFENSDVIIELKNGDRIPVSFDVTLLHELAHAVLHMYGTAPGTYTLPVDPAMGNRSEELAIETENAYRRERGLPERSGYFMSNMFIVGKDGELIPIPLD